MNRTIIHWTVTVSSSDGRRGDQSGTNIVDGYLSDSQAADYVLSRWPGRDATIKNLLVEHR